MQAAHMNPIFQFHLVRLKALFKNQKRTKMKFQFHLVRLKAPVLPTDSFRIMHFNSI